MTVTRSVEMLQEMIDGRRAKPNIWGIMGIAMESAEPGLTTFVGRPSATHTNGIGSIHGGWAATILDSAMATAVQSRLDVGTAYTTVEFKISFTRRIEPDAVVRVTGKVLSQGRRLATAEGEIRDEAGRLLAHGTTTCLIL